MEHTWVVQEVDTGPFDGISKFWRCDVCGLAGGPVWNRAKLDAMPKMGPFIPGLGASMRFPDCEVARTFVREWIDDSLKRLRNRRNTARGKHHFASLIADAIRWTPEKTDLVPIVGILLRMQHGYDRNYTRRHSSLIEVRCELVEAGFLVTPREVTDAIQQLTSDPTHIDVAKALSKLT